MTGTNDMEDFWTNEKEQQLTELWPTHSGSELGAHFGKSRNAIIGKARRMGLPSKKKTGNKPSKPKLEPKVRFRATVFVSSQIDLLLEEPDHSSAIPLLDATFFQCKAVIDPHGDPNGLAMVCGQPIEPGIALSFCPYHMSRFTIKNYRREGGMWLRPLK